VPGSVPIAIVSSVVSLAVSAFLVPTGFNLAYSDAQSHLTIARRLLDIRENSGLVQLGTVWLPVPHLLLAPLVIPLYMWRTGWGAALLGAACMSLTAVGLYRSSARWGARRVGRLTAVAVALLNPNMLYLAATALTEPVLIAAMSLTLAGLANVATRHRMSSPGEVAIFCGIPAALAALSRYEGWALTLTGAIFLAVVTSQPKPCDLCAVFSTVAGFVTPPILAMGWWIGFNWVVFHNPLEFLNGEYSANAQQAAIVARGISTKLDIVSTIRSLNYAVTSSVGWVGIGLGFLGLLTLLRARGLVNRALFLVASASSYLFLLVALYTGQAIIWNSASGATYNWNNRFGMASVLPVALLVSVVSEAPLRLTVRLAKNEQARRKVLMVTVSAILSLLLLQMAWFLQHPTQRSLIINEASESWTAGAPSRAAAHWLGDHYDGGDILIDETGSVNAHLPEIGIPLKNFYLRANGELFDLALADPTNHATWVWMSTSSSDRARELLGSSSFSANYQPVFSNSDITIFKKDTP
jgi:hypothetical protein